MINIPYVGLAPGGQQAPQIPVMQAARGQGAQAMGNVSSALNSQSSQAESLMNHYLSQAQQQRQSLAQAVPGWLSALWAL